MSTKTLPSQRIPAPDLAFLSRLGGETEIHEIGEFFSLGRDHENTLSLADPFISTRHARIEQRAQGYFLRDLRSRNGTYLNGTSVVEAQLSCGDRIRVGQTEFIFSHIRDQKTQNLHLKSKNVLWNEQLQKLSSIAQSEMPVLLSGPSGSGKEILAQSLHRYSDRVRNPFISVNCSALSESLVESELFGHIKGSFTGASSDRKGAFESARGGTLFLDEIGDLPLPLQPKLLRALENQEIRPVGSDRSIQTDVRIIAATHKSLKKLVMEGSFRADLYFRLHVVQIQSPALYERIEDFEDLLFLFAKDLRVRFSFAAIERLKSHSWPGNIRELKNTVSRARALYPDRQVEAEDVESLIDRMPGHQWPVQREPAIKSIEREMICDRLLANRGNQRRTALELGLPKSTLHDRIKAYNINIEELLQLRA